LVIGGGPLLGFGCLWWTPEHLPHGRRQVGDRHLNFHKGRDNLAAPAQQAQKLT